MAFISCSLTFTSSMNAKSMDDVKVREQLMKAQQHMPEPHTVQYVKPSECRRKVLLH